VVGHDAMPSVATLWPPDGRFMSVSIEGVTDPDGDPVTITIDGVVNDETGSADAEGVGTSTALQRAAPSGSGDGRVYTISFTASDDRGGTASGSVEVLVPHDVS
jgi:hypothetical protein